MEITTSPTRPAQTPWGRLLVLVVILGPVTVLVLLPIGLGLQRYVMSGDSMNGGIDRGSVVFERAVPVSDLEVGDVITYHAPTGDGRMVTHRIVAIAPDGIVTQGDASPVRDPWTLRPDEPTVSRVVFALPWVGYGYLALLRPHTWAMLLVPLSILAALLVGEVVSRRRTPSADHEVLDAAGSPATAGGTRRANSAD